MRAWPLVLLLAPLAAAQEGQLVERDGWTQFVPEWRAGPAEIVWQGRNASVPEGVSYATDGSGWLYGSTETPEALRAEHACGFGDNATAVVLSVSRCTVARHPSIACAGTDLCDAGIGQMRPSGPPPRGHAVAREGWTQFVPWWRTGPAEFAFGDASYAVPAGIAFATDGGTWLYGSDESVEVLSGEHACAPPKDENVTAVVVSVRSCTLARHPGVSCVATDICLLGRAPPAATVPRETSPTFPVDSCGRVQGAYCTPAVPLADVLFLLAALALIACGRGRA